MKVAVCLLLAAALSCCQADVGAQCTEGGGECGADECCRVLHIFPGKRQLISVDPDNKKGSCVRWEVEGGACFTEGPLSGSCGCGQGLSCQPVVYPDLSFFSHMCKRTP